MASAAVTTRAYPKRKRAEVSYCEVNSDESEVDDESASSDEELTTKARKKLKTSRTKAPEKPLPKRKIFPFMSLPAELKNQIYAEALTDANGIYLISKTRHYRRTVQRSTPGSYSSGHRRSRYNWYRHQSQSSESSADTITVLSLVPNILLLNRATYAETQPILYAGNAFTVEDTTAMHAFLATIGPKNRATITDLAINGWGYTKAHKALNHPAFTMLASAVNLERLHLDCKIGWGGLMSVARQLYRDGFHWLEAVGAARGRFDAALDLIEISEENLAGCAFSRMPQVEKSVEEKMEEVKTELRRMLAR